MFIKRMRKLTSKAKEELELLHKEDCSTTEHLIEVFTEVLQTNSETSDTLEAGTRIREVLSSAGGTGHLLQQCEHVSAHHGDRYQPLVWRFYSSHRKALFSVIKTLALSSTTSDQTLIDAMNFIIAHEHDPKSILDILMRNQSTIKPTTIHLDTQGQNLPVFGLSYLLGVELMPRIRNWKELKFYRPSKEMCYEHIDSLFEDNVIEWNLIQTHWQDLLRVVISVQEGKVLPSMLLRKLTISSRKNRLYQAFHALGTIVRTVFLLKFISDVKLRELIHHSTNKVEQYNAFEDWITFASAGTIYERAYVEQETRPLSNCCLHHR